MITYPMKLRVTERENDCEESEDFDFSLRKDGETIWCTSKVIQTTTTKRQNIVNKLNGPRQRARHVRNEIQAFFLFISLEMIDNILDCSNKYIAPIVHKFSRERDCFKRLRYFLECYI